MTYALQSQIIQCARLTNARAALRPILNTKRLLLLFYFVAAINNRYGNKFI